MTPSKTTPETRLKRAIKQYLGYRGWFVRHIIQGMGAYRGIPDILATKGGLTIEIEAKAPKGRQSEHQIKYQADLEAHGGTYLLIKDISELETWLDRKKPTIAEDRVIR
jgi:hypothetical protein